MTFDYQLLPRSEKKPSFDEPFDDFCDEKLSPLDAQHISLTMADTTNPPPPALHHHHHLWRYPHHEALFHSLVVILCHPLHLYVDLDEPL